jgi:hypothetical protein
VPKSYAQAAILDWLSRSIGIDHRPSPDEVKTQCPLCHGDVFFFNVKKKVGICHKASCNFRPNIEQLIEKIGFGPNESGEWETPVEPSLPEVVLHGAPVLKMVDGQLLTSSDEALSYLRGRGINDQITLNWEITANDRRVYVPIKHEGRLVNWNGRLLPGREGKKYLYSKGAKTSHYILGWEECQSWSTLCLVENTFVSLAYRYSVGCSTTFGSNVSDTQADMISRSRIKTVALLWDQNSEKSASRSIKKLHARGVNAAFWSITGQPDDHSIEWVIDGANQVINAANKGESYADLRIRSRC